MNDAIARAAPPKSFWIIAVVSLLWNAFGPLDYTMVKMHNAAWIASMGVDPAMVAKIDAAPVWGTIGWALGVWGSLAGSILLLLRSRHAVSAFLISLVGAVVGFAWQFSADMVPSAALPATILVIVLALWWYSRRCAGQGILE